MSSSSAYRVVYSPVRRWVRVQSGYAGLSGDLRFVVVKVGEGLFSLRVEELLELIAGRLDWVPTYEIVAPEGRRQVHAKAWIP